MSKDYCGVCGQPKTEPDYEDAHKMDSCDWMERRLAEEGLSRKYAGVHRF